MTPSYRNPSTDQEFEKEIAERIGRTDWMDPSEAFRDIFIILMRLERHIERVEITQESQYALLDFRMRSLTQAYEPRKHQEDMKTRWTAPADDPEMSKEEEQ